MRQLLYCIFKGTGPKTENITGVRGKTVREIAKEGIKAVVSAMQDEEPPLEFAELISYSRVIESYQMHKDIKGLIPLRYGCVVREAGDVARLLDEEYEYLKLELDRLAGCVEMGVSIVPSAEHVSGTDMPEYSGGSSPGRDYLAARKFKYEKEAELRTLADGVLEQLLRHLSGLFKEYRRENGPSVFRRDIVQLGRRDAFYFLVDKNLVPEFRRVLEEFISIVDVALHLSGPWPPYNFVLPPDPPEDIYINRIL